ncbi:unnamed protein product [Microthlaspi erraticum]|uniref:DUF220 domain-containing protein n=1 Tax=Microthlaspi erraticum TaxID=1685480 RepID=A0A6D2JF80_9BRAS|nr:unnamed protein product [Microthlaspi erraticum]
MGVFPRFGGWITQDTQQPHKAESKRSENVESMPVSEENNNNVPAKKKKKEYFDNVHERKQDLLWHDAEKKHPWYNPPLKTKYKKEKLKFMKVFEGSYKVEPIYVDSERLCKQRLPKSREEYKQCSGGQGKIASKVTMDQYFKPYPPFNLPPLSWFVRGITIKTTKSLLKMVQHVATRVREAERIGF